MKDNPKGIVVQNTVGEPAAWVYEKPQRNGKMNLLTIGGISVTGTWYGELGESFLAWAPLLKRDKAKEREILASRPKPGFIRVSDHVKITSTVTPAPQQMTRFINIEATVKRDPGYCDHGERCTYECMGKARGHCR